MSEEERERVYRLQCWIQARKTCAYCGVSKWVAFFAGYGAKECRACEGRVVVRR